MNTKKSIAECCTLVGIVKGQHRAGQISPHAAPVDKRLIAIFDIARGMHVLSNVQLVYILNRECQRADWKSHRQICGKIIDPEFVLVPDKIDDDELIPVPIPSFCRSPALLHQITYLRTLPEADYTVS